MTTAVMLTLQYQEHQHDIHCHRDPCFIIFCCHIKLLLLELIATMFTFADDIIELEALHHEKEKWKFGSIDIQVATSFASDEPLTINLAATLGHNKRIFVDHVKKKSADVYWLLKPCQ